MNTGDLKELKVIAGGSITALLHELAPRFEKSNGHRLSIHFDSTPNIIARMTSGTPFDALVVPSDVLRDSGAKALLATSPVADIARVGCGLIVRAGAAKPDISTCEFFQGLLPVPQTLDVRGSFGRGRVVQRRACLIERFVGGCGIQAIVADLLQTFGQHVLRETPEEFHLRNGDELAGLGAKCHLVLGD